MTPEPISDADLADLRAHLDHYHNSPVKRSDHHQFYGPGLIAHLPALLARLDAAEAEVKRLTAAHERRGELLANRDIECDDLTARAEAAEAEAARLRAALYEADDYIDQAGQSIYQHHPYSAALPDLEEARRVLAAALALAGPAGGGA